MTKHDRFVYRQVAQLHATGINNGFLSTLGVPFLALLYEAIDANESSVLLTVQHEGLVVGFVAGAEGMGSIYRQLLRRWHRLIWALLPSFLSPHKLRKILEILILNKKQTAMTGEPVAELLSIAVDTTALRQSNARTLYLALVDHFRLRGVHSFQIVVGDSLSAAHKFYQAMGAVATQKIEVHNGQMSVVYVHRVF